MISTTALARRYGGRRTHVRVTVEVWRDGQRVMRTQIGRGPDEDRDETNEPARHALTLATE
jgi:hypothetical protein